MGTIKVLTLGVGDAKEVNIITSLEDSARQITALRALAMVVFRKGELAA